MLWFVRLSVLFAGLILLAPAPWAQPADASPSLPLPALVDRLTWGATPAELVRARALGAEGYIQAQLQPGQPEHLPAAVQQHIDALSISRQTAQQAALAERAYQARVKRIADPAEQAAARRGNWRISRHRADETAQRAVWRALYTPHQLLDQMTWFWMNHFNVYSGKANVGALIDDYESRTIRPYALGKFRDLLAATARAPAMLIYLDNVRNRAGRLNENYARELMELHTLGIQGGYTQRDVQELARTLTGLTVHYGPKPPVIRPALRNQLVHNGLFLFNPARHDPGAKQLLGQRIQGGGLAEVDQALDLLARHPATARHISRKLAEFFVSDAPDPALVQALSHRFLQTDGDIAATLRLLFSSPAFAQSLRTGRFKDPVHYLYSALRLAYVDQPPIRNAKAVVAWLKRLGQPLNLRLTPDGYPLGSSDWSGSGQMTTRFEAARAIATIPARFYRRERETDLPALAPLPRLVDAYGANGPFTALAPATHAAIDTARSVRDANTYLLASPDFMRR